MTKPSLPQGTRDFSAATIHKRNFILHTISSVFELHGFEPLETPAMENLETLMGKYGDEGDKLIYRILDSGNPFPNSFFTDFFNALKIYNENLKRDFEGRGLHIPGPMEIPLLDINPSVFSSLVDEFIKSKEYSNKFLSRLKKESSGKALKYDLTIPFARYVAMNHGQLTFPYKRYQVQPVWRADRPQKGRYREFTQCDADVVGSTSLINEIELCNIYHTAFTKMGLKQYALKINSRKILAALAELCGGADKMMDITIAIDKLDKIGLDKVHEELQQKGLNTNQISTINTYLNIKGSNEEKLLGIKELFENNQTAEKGIAEISFIFHHTKNVNISIDFTLARGLNYYTGIIFEAKAPAGIQMGSIGGGGRYDDLTGLFGVPGIPGVGISFGVDRIYDVLEELKLFPENMLNITRALFFNMGKKESLFALQYVQQLRNSGIACELYHEPAKMDKQFKYADKKFIPFAVIIGSKEMENEEAVVKNLSTAEQQKMPLIRLPDFFKQIKG